MTMVAAIDLSRHGGSVNRFYLKKWSSLSLLQNL
jgi:hypothetical protein